MFLQGRVIIVWLSWLIGGVCGVFILLVIICYCRLMPRHQKSLDEQYLKENYTIKENHAYSNQDNYRMKHAEVQVQRVSRPASYAGDQEGRRAQSSHCYVNRVPARPPAALPPLPHHSTQYASSSMLDEIDSGASVDALKTRSLPAFLRPKPRPLSTEDDLQQLYAKIQIGRPVCLMRVF
ncbi:uncharacterized protein LOC114253303 isoform X2 [Bombyx mandarina]|uniref:Uncharacterized protein LOC114253303 isoform X2 n=1 Tax=Bombyx mandarina TaxID=7092 RepID=A0A6J2KUR1_BOMMA|nr:uncharacterized protein LOC114253303 isoform X2 [Bombyx mandarina]